MKSFTKVIFLITSIITIPSLLLAQSFTKITTGPHVTDGVGSRSVNFIDVNNDGYPDLFVSNGEAGGQNNLLYMNNGDGTFAQDLADPIANDGLSSDGASFADINNDYLVDAFIGNWYGQNNRLYLNNGAGFTLLAAALPSIQGGYTESCSWADYDNDGDLDLFVANSDGDLLNFFYINDGNGSFIRDNSTVISTDTDVSRSGLWADYDNDDDLDLYVCNEGASQNRLYENNGDGTFTKVLTGEPVTDIMNSWSGSWADFDNDGDLDLFVANNGGELNALYQNNGDKTFTKLASNTVGLSFNSSASSSFIDYDNDGDLDLFVTNGWGSPQNNLLYNNDGAGNYIQVSESPFTSDLGWSYGSGWADYDRDGDLDVMIARWLSETEDNTFYRNDIGSSNNWLGIKLNGTVSNSSAIGTQFSIVATINSNPVRQFREVSSQHGYCTQNSFEEIIGLGDATSVDSIIIDWPSGIQQVLTNVAGNQYLDLYEPGVRILADTLFGSDNLDVQFSGITGLTVTDWEWNFGDGGSSSAPAPSHSYTSPGSYTVTVDVTATEGNFSASRTAYIGIEADTVTAVNKTVSAGSSISVDISIKNHIPLTEMEIPVQWTGGLVPTLDSVGNTGLRTSFMTLNTPSVDLFNKRLVCRLTAPDDSLLAPGDGPVVSLYFTLPASPAGDTAVFSFVDYNTYALSFDSPFGSYLPDTLSGFLSIKCCFNERGNVDNDENDEVNISDLLYFVDYSFATPPGPEPACPEEADVDGSGAIDISDILYLVDYMFANPAGPAPINCPE